jgi:transposase
LAKHVFQVHGVDAEGAVVLRKQVRRGQVLAFFSRLPCCVVEQAGHMTASDLCAARQIISCQAGAIHT